MNMAKTVFCPIDERRIAGELFTSNSVERSSLFSDKFLARYSQQRAYYERDLFANASVNANYGQVSPRRNVAIARDDRSLDSRIIGDRFYQVSVSAKVAEFAEFSPSRIIGDGAILRNSSTSNDPRNFPSSQNFRHAFATSLSTPVVTFLR